MVRARDGDSDAFATLTQRYTPRVLGYFRKHGGDRSEAEDLTQEVFLRLYRSRARYQPKASFATWVFHIMQNVLRNALRSQRRRRFCASQDLTDEATRPEGLWDDADAPWRPLERAELADVVRGAVSGLAQRSRAAIELHQLEERSYAVVAAELGMTTKALKCLLYRARNQLRGALTPFVEGARRG
jgi:RNA polymerase sigma-70 factor (ECF subfamily)